MKVYDYRILECFDLDEMTHYFLIQKYNFAQQEYVLYSPKRFLEFQQARYAVKMLRRYEEPIYHYVD